MSGVLSGIDVILLPTEGHHLALVPTVKYFYMKLHSYSGVIH